MRTRSLFCTLGAIAFPAIVHAQIVRSTPPPAADSSKPAVVADSMAPVEVARREQSRFEAFRRVNLPHVVAPSRRKCDEVVGRLCYWYDESETMPEEREVVRTARSRFLAVLDSLARLEPADLWLAEVRVRYLAESERLGEALAVARACGGKDRHPGDWRCEILEGFTLHLLGEYVEAERVYDAALNHMGAGESCVWRDVALLLDEVAVGQYRNIPCGDRRRDVFAERAWFLARTLYSMPGNDSRTEYFARMTMVQMLRGAPGAYQFGFDADERELLIRFGWPRAWAADFTLPFTVEFSDAGRGGPTGGGGSGGSGRPGGEGPGAAKGRGRGGTPVGSLPPGTKVPSNVPPRERPPDMAGPRGLPGGLGGPPDSRPTLPRIPTPVLVPCKGDCINVVGIEAFPAYRYIPAGFVLSDPTQSDSAAWRPQLPPVMARYAPAYARTLVPLDHQKAVFKRGDTALVVLAYDTKGASGIDSARIRAGLVVTPVSAPLHQYATLRESAPSSGVLTVRAPYGPLLMSAEVAAPDRRAVARARYGIGPARGMPMRVALSDLLFYKTFGSTPRSVEEVAPHALPTERMRASDKLGVYWEAYGTNPTGETMKVSLIVAREETVEDGGFLRRMTRALARDRTPVSITVADLSAVGSTTSPRALEFDISTLTTGTYIVQLEIEVAGQPVVRAEHRIDIVGP